MIPLWKGKNPIYFGVIRSKVKVTVNMQAWRGLVKKRVAINRCIVTLDNLDNFITSYFK
jgi:hypothetical protein